MKRWPFILGFWVGFFLNGYAWLIGNREAQGTAVTILALCFIFWLAIKE